VANDEPIAIGTNTTNFEQYTNKSIYYKNSKKESCIYSYTTPHARPLKKQRSDDVVIHCTSPNDCLCKANTTLRSPDSKGAITKAKTLSLGGTPLPHKRDLTKTIFFAITNVNETWQVRSVVGCHDSGATLSAIKESKAAMFEEMQGIQPVTVKTGGGQIKITKWVKVPFVVERGERMIQILVPMAVLPTESLPVNSDVLLAKYDFKVQLQVDEKEIDRREQMGQRFFITPFLNSIHNKVLGEGDNLKSEAGLSLVDGAAQKADDLPPKTGLRPGMGIPSIEKRKIQQEDTTPGPGPPVATTAERQKQFPLESLPASWFLPESGALYTLTQQLAGERDIDPSDYLDRKRVGPPQGGLPRPAPDSRKSQNIHDATPITPMHHDTDRKWSYPHTDSRTNKTRPDAGTLLQSSTPDWYERGS